MAPFKVLLTGVTGFVGGDSLYAIANAHPDWQLSALVRNADKAAKLRAQYLNIRVVRGDLDSVDITEEEVADADIVFSKYFADSGHVATATAISKDLRARSFGVERPKEYNDWEGVSELLHMPPNAVHRNVDEIVIDASKSNPASVNTAIVCPPIIYGASRGPCTQKSLLASLSVAVLQRRKGFLLYHALGDAAAAGGGNAMWNNDNYYLADNGPFVWGDVQRAVTKAAFEKNLIPSPEVEQLNDAQIMELISEGYYGFYAWGTKFSWSCYSCPIVELEAKDSGLL
ncbi:hypothetical protein PENFLA_c027G01626 [Penicillium flavigenum]|uniref:NAD(P)-binding domain-containing protein n=1 Tax=Penicillium flavigenum TaxID=254877 RepID=A0A1V6SS96_9EURO|nr:hypothetical protein PENFLA_c027G01626 [Penicillium flavigenum]